MKIGIYFVSKHGQTREIATFLAAQLHNLGCDTLAIDLVLCAIVATETDAVAAAARCNPDLMIVDARLRDGSGISAVEKILRNGWVPHVFVSGETSSGQTLRPGAIVIQKPFRDMDLDRAIQRALDAPASS